MTRMARAHDGAGIAWCSTGEGEPLLLISGQAVDSSAWDAVVPTFAESFRVITVDHRGTGESEPGTDEAYSTRSFARDALAVLDHAGVDRAHVYGHSMGGRVAQWLAIDSPDRVASLVLGATTAGDEGGVPRSAAATADLASGDADRLARLFFVDAGRRADAEAFFDQKASARAKRLHRRASRAHDTWDLLGRIVAPTLVIHGADDAMSPAGNAELMAERIPDSRLALLPGARHGYYLEHPAASDVVIDFLRHVTDRHGPRTKPCSRTLPSITFTQRPQRGGPLRGSSP